MKLSKVRLVMSGPGKGDLFIDDQKIDGVTKVSIECAVNQMNNITICMAVAETIVEGVFDVTTISDDSKKFASA